MESNLNINITRTLNLEAYKILYPHFEDLLNGIYFNLICNLVIKIHGYCNCIE